MIQFYFVRYGRLGRTGWFGTIHEVSIVRGDKVVVQTAEGMWLGDVLNTFAPSASENIDPIQHTSKPKGLVGELIRRANSLDLEATSARNQLIRDWVARVAEVTATVDKSIVVLDIDLALNLEIGIIQFAGAATALLGPLAASLADQLSVDRVQWLPYHATGIITGTDDVNDRPEQEAKARADRKTDNISLASWLSGLSTSDGQLLSRFAKDHRSLLGLAGCYLQKLRDSTNSSSLGSMRRQWMVRVKASGGRMSMRQLLSLIGLAEKHGDGTLRLTMRQGLQFHGVKTGRVVETLSDIEGLAMTTAGSCGNALRNVTCCPYSMLQSRHACSHEETLLRRESVNLASRIANRFIPRSNYFSWNWLRWQVTEFEGSDSSSELHGPIADSAYPDGYLPHKWKIGIALPDDNCINVRTNDLGFVVRMGGSAAPLTFLVDCYVGGSIAYKPGKSQSFATLGQALGRFRIADVDRVIDTLMNLHREKFGDDSVKIHGSRHPRHYNRLKYLVAQMGIERLASEVQQRVGSDIFRSYGDTMPVGNWVQHRGVIRDDEGLYTAVIEVLGGRLPCSGVAGNSLKKLLALGSAVSVGPRHSLVVGGLEAASINQFLNLIENELAHCLVIDARGVFGEISQSKPKPQIPMLTCVGLPTCPLAITESERVREMWQTAANEVRDEIAFLCGNDGTEGLKFGLAACPNGCSQPLCCDLGIIAEGNEQYRVFIGGSSSELAISVGAVSTPEQLISTIKRLYGQAVTRGMDRKIVPIWLRGQADSVKFAWPGTKN